MMFGGAAFDNAPAKNVTKTIVKANAGMAEDLAFFATVGLSFDIGTLVLDEFLKNEIVG